MAGDWIKMTVGLRSHPKVVRMASALKADRLRVIGGLFAVWSVFDQHSPDGLLEGYTLQAIDEDLGWKGFGAAMESIGWLIEAEDGLSAPRFEDHNGTSAKRRALDTRRKKDDREDDKTAHGSWDSGGQMSASHAEKARTREELDKKRIPPTPLKGDAGPPGFAEFWSMWPNTERKANKKGCLNAWMRKNLESHSATILAHVTSLKSSKKWLDGYEPAPMTYLNQERWADGVEVEQPSGGEVIL